MNRKRTQNSPSMFLKEGTAEVQPDGFVPQAQNRTRTLSETLHRSPFPFRDRPLFSATEADRKCLTSLNYVLPDPFGACSDPGHTAV